MSRTVETNSNSTTQSQDHITITVDEHVNLLASHLTHVNTMPANISDINPHIGRITHINYFNPQVGRFDHINTANTHIARISAQDPLSPLVDTAKPYMDIVDGNVDAMDLEMLPALIEITNLPEENDAGGKISVSPEDSVVVLRVDDCYPQLPVHHTTTKSMSSVIKDRVTINVEDAQDGTLIHTVPSSLMSPIVTSSELLCVSIPSPNISMPSTSLIPDALTTSPTACGLLPADLQAITSYVMDSDGVLNIGESCMDGESVNVMVPTVVTSVPSVSPSMASRINVMPSESPNTPPRTNIYVKKSGSVVIKMKKTHIESTGPVLITREMDDGKKSDAVKLRVVDSHADLRSTSPPCDIPLKRNDKASTNLETNRQSTSEKAVLGCSDGSNILIKRHIVDNRKGTSSDYVTIGGTRINRNTLLGTTSLKQTKKASKKFPTQQAKSKQKCSLCHGTINSGEMVAIVPVNKPLPLSSLNTVSLLKCLSACPANFTLEPNSGDLSLCRKCYYLVLEGDTVYKCLLGLTQQMKQQWLKGREKSGPPIAPEGKAKVGIKKVPQYINKFREQQQTRRYPPILPKLQDASRVRDEEEGTPDKVKKEANKMLICGFCGMDLYGEEDFRLHSAAVHMVRPLWQQWAKNQPALKTRLAREIQHDGVNLNGGQRILRKCCACGREYPERENLVEHLRHYHNMTIDEGFLDSVIEAASDMNSSDSHLASQEVCRGHNFTNQRQSNHHKITSQNLGEAHQLTNQSTGVKQEVVLEEVVGAEGDIFEDTVEENIKTEQVRTFAIKRERGRQVTDFSSPLLFASEQYHSWTSTPKSEDTVVSTEKLLVGQWRCRICSDIFTSQVDHDQHKLAKHPESVRTKRRKIMEDTIEKPLFHKVQSPQANMSNKFYDTENALDNDRQTSHSSLVILEGDGSGGVKQHRVTLSSTNRVEESKNSYADDLSLRGSYVCTSCGEAFVSQMLLEEHNQSVHGEVGRGGIIMVECELCGRKLHGTSALHLHQCKVHHRTLKSPLKHRCRLCIFHSRTRSQLEKHMQEKHGASALPSVRCSYCGNSYSAKYIDKHIANMHQNQKKYACNLCFMKYSVETSLKSHIFHEHANNRWVCEICQEEFSRYHQLRQHRTYLHSSKVFPCAQCDRTFKRRSDLTEHVKRRHQAKSPSRCPHCPKVYSDRKKLRMHLMDKHGVAWEDTLAKTFARHQRENNCYRRRPQDTSHHTKQQQQQHSQGRPPPAGGPQQVETGRGTTGQVAKVLEAGKELKSDMEVGEAMRSDLDAGEVIIKGHKVTRGAEMVGEMGGETSRGTEMIGEVSRNASVVGGSISRSEEITGEVGEGLEVGGEVSVTSYDATLEGQDSYSVVHVKHLSDISYIILQEP